MTATENLKIDWFFVNQDIQVQIEHKNSNWYDSNGKLKVEYLFDELGNGELIEVNEINPNVGRSLWCCDNKLYELHNSDVSSLKNKGLCRMYYVGALKDWVDIKKENDQNFLKWWFSTDTVEQAIKQLNKVI